MKPDSKNAQASKICGHAGAEFQNVGSCVHVRRIVRSEGVLNEKLCLLMTKVRQLFKISSDDNLRKAGSFESKRRDSSEYGLLRSQVLSAYPGITFTFFPPTARKVVICLTAADAALRCRLKG